MFKNVCLFISVYLLNKSLGYLNESVCNNGFKVIYDYSYYRKTICKLVFLCYPHNIYISLQKQKYIMIILDFLILYSWLEIFFQLVRYRILGIQVYTYFLLAIIEPLLI